MKNALRGQNKQSAKALLNAIVSSNDDLGTLCTLADESLEGVRILKNALSVVDDPLEVVRFLDFLGKDELNKGTAKRCVEKFYMAAFTTPGLLDQLHESLQNRRITGTNNYSVLTWFLAAVVSIDSSAREKRSVLEIVDMLLRLDSGESNACSAISALLYSNFRPADAARGDVVFDPGSVQSLTHLQDLNPQHDNDHPLDFRRVEILPTVEELTSTALTSVGFPEPSDSMPVGVACGHLLNRQFRLLREDMLAPMKEEMKTELELPPNKQRRVFGAPEIVDIVLEPRACLLVRVGIPLALRERLKGMKRNDLCNFFEESGRRVLGKESMVVFLQKNDSTGHVVQAVGLVVRRDVKELAVHDGYLTVGIAFSDSFLNEMLSTLQFQPNYDKGQHDNNDKHKKPFKRGSRFASCLFQATSSYFSYAPVLMTLQTMSNIPFAEEIAMNSPPLPVNSTCRIPRRIEEKLASDRSQLNAVKSAMRQRMTLVQGPPGTTPHDSRIHQQL
jgi:hypothetical protein